MVKPRTFARLIRLTISGDDVLQDLAFQYRKLRDTAPIQVNQEYVTRLQESTLKAGDQCTWHLVASFGSILRLLAAANIPSTQELSQDATSIVESIQTILRLVFTSSSFRALLKDILELARDYISYTAGEVADVALEVQVAAEDVERAAQTTDISVEDIKGKAKEIYNDVRDVAAGNGSRSNGVPPSRDPRTVAYDRVQLVRSKVKTSSGDYSLMPPLSRSSPPLTRIRGTLKPYERCSRSSANTSP